MPHHSIGGRHEHSNLKSVGADMISFIRGLPSDVRDPDHIQQYLYLMHAAGRVDWIEEPHLGSMIRIAVIRGGEEGSETTETERDVKFSVEILPRNESTSPISEPVTSVFAKQDDRGSSSSLVETSSKNKEDTDNDTVSFVHIDPARSSPPSLATTSSGRSSSTPSDSTSQVSKSKSSGNHSTSSRGRVRGSARGRGGRAPVSRGSNTLGPSTPAEETYFRVSYVPAVVPVESAPSVLFSADQDLSHAPPALGRILRAYDALSKPGALSRYLESKNPIEKESTRKQDTECDGECQLSPIRKRLCGNDRTVTHVVPSMRTPYDSLFTCESGFAHLRDIERMQRQKKSHIITQDLEHCANEGDSKSSSFERRVSSWTERPPPADYFEYAYWLTNHLSQSVKAESSFPSTSSNRIGEGNTNSTFCWSPRLHCGLKQLVLQSPFERSLRHSSEHRLTEKPTVKQMAGNARDKQLRQALHDAWNISRLEEDAIKALADTNWDV